MLWNPSVLFTAFRAVGMTQSAVYDPAGVATAFSCGFTTPDLVLLGDQQQGADVEIEWPTASLPAVRRGAVFQITQPGGAVVTYRASEHARSVGDGTYSRVYLEAGA